LWKNGDAWYNFGTPYRGWTHKHHILIIYYRLLMLHNNCNATWCAWPCCSLKLGPHIRRCSLCTSNLAYIHEYMIHVFVVYLLEFLPHHGFKTHLSIVGASISQGHYGILMMGTWLVLSLSNTKSLWHHIPAMGSP